MTNIKIKHLSARSSQKNTYTYVNGTIVPKSENPDMRMKIQDHCRDST
jgi:hypothetical protein